MITDVKEFHHKFDLPEGRIDLLTPNQEIQQFRLRFLQEELDELKEALSCGDRVKAFDALLDLAYVLEGTALYLGVGVNQWYIGSGAVHRCNMRKIRARSAGESKRRSKLDVIKPADWVGPEQQLRSILEWKNQRG